MPSLSLWAAVPTYVSGPRRRRPRSPSSAGSPTCSSVDVDTTGLEAESRGLPRAASTSSWPTTRTSREFLARLEEAYDEDDADGTGDPADLIDEVERYLRDQ